MIRRAFTVCAVAAAAALCGCATPAVVLVSADYSASRIKKVAMAPFRDFPGSAGSGEIAADVFEEYLLMPGYQLVERRQVDALLKEHGFELSGNVDPNQIKQLGHMLGVDALVLGAVSDFQGASEQTVMVDVPQETMPPLYGGMVGEYGGAYGQGYAASVGYGYGMPTETSIPETEFVPAHVAFTAKLVDVESAEVLWTVSTGSDGNDPGSALQAASSKAMSSLVEQLRRLPPH